MIAENESIANALFHALNTSSRRSRRSRRLFVVLKLLPPRRMSSKAIFLAILLLCFRTQAFADEVAGRTQPTADHPMKVKVVVLAMFENGADTGDVPGEYQFWVERRKMDYVIPLPAAFHD